MERKSADLLTNETECPVPNGILLVIGGAEDRGQDEQKYQGNNVHMEVLQTFVDLMDKEQPRIELITSASDADVNETYKEYQEAFIKCGAGNVGHINHNKFEEVNFEELEQRLREADGIFIAGGDQLKLTSIYGGTKLLMLLKNRYIYEKLVIAGTSAGAMALSTPMIYAGVGRDEMIAGNVKVTTGLEFLKDICIDTHFVHRGRFVRISQVIAENPTSIGIGIEEDTAIIVRNGTDMEVIGCGVIIVINARHSYGSTIADNREELLTIRGLEVDILAKGQHYQFDQVNPPHH
ncbi:cyanophycinase [Mucilaginibacter sp. RS28]|uniref:Cyanophycinase n=1 Tax=Mucilaginibacter straminoryzae TaxID=2932774 RepID=A0A9X2BCC8_9SPHI|nr:cyanophycinase [Mucilaginibacter straminoryzae]MCJ8209178.1 cyanophycinase [Mucilaginibacter straminoryzae]